MSCVQTDEYVAKILTDSSVWFVLPSPGATDQTKVRAVVLENVGKSGG